VLAHDEEHARVNYKAHFRRALEADPDRVHLAAHSHHLWPDASFDGHMEAWNVAARLADRKWEAIFGDVIPRAQLHVARTLGLRDPGTIAFAPSTHELYMRILSCLPRGRTLRILTTDGEFHSFARQTARLEEDGDLEVVRVATQPFGTFTERFLRAAQGGRWDLVYLSHVFFNSGYVVPDLGRIALSIVSRETFVVIDGYHAFLALPVDLSDIEDRVFYMGGGYKYAMTGEGACFLHVPPGFGDRPRDTGWYAAFGALAESQTPGRVAYAAGGARFLGATLDPTALFRFNAVMDWLGRIGVSAREIHAHALALQERFVAELGKEPLLLAPDQLVVPITEPSRGQFLTFQTPRAAEVHARLLAANVVTDVRGDRLRVGFGIYQDEGDVMRAIERMRKL
jgi:selenocysteine lyase/cysteine desulfurase